MDVCVSVGVRKLHGYAGKILYIDLTRQKTVKKETNRALINGYIGGKGFGAKILYDALRPGCDALGTDNEIIFATGPLNGTLAPGSGRHVVVTKSPLTGIFLDSYSGGHWGPELKFAGYDALVIFGRAYKPTYLLIEDEIVTFKDAKDLWGRDCFETELTLRRDLGDIKVSCIGPAGENLVKIACICNESFHQAGRGGSGAVMGSKRLKAIAVRGTGGLTIADPGLFNEALEEARKKIMETPHYSFEKPNYGTPFSILPASEEGILPTKNFQSGVFEKAEEISGEVMKEKYFVKDLGCFSCTIKCGKVTRIQKGPLAGTILLGPEYETLAMLGSNCGVSNFDSIMYANLLCDKMGLDTISTGNVIGFVMECFERGLVTEDETDGLELRFGNHEAIIETIRKIAYREGIGDLLSDGVRVASQKIGKGSEAFAVHVKGLEVPGWDSRGGKGWGLLYATADIGASHLRASYGGDYLYKELPDSPMDSDLVKIIVNDHNVVDAMFTSVVCTPWDMGPRILTKLIGAATGIMLTLDRFIEMGERIWNLVRVFNVREGITRADDTLPQRLMEPLPEGRTKGCKSFVDQEDFRNALNMYYRARGWDLETGIPTRSTLERLDLQEAIQNLESLNLLKSG